MQKFDTGNLQLDVSGQQDGSSLQPVPAGWFQYTRGGANNDYHLRLTIANTTGAMSTGNPSRTLTVSDIYDTFNKTNIMYAAQFADYITMGVSVDLLPKTPVAAAQPCVGAQAALVKDIKMNKFSKRIHP